MIEPSIQFYVDGKHARTQPMGNVPRVGDTLHWRLFSDNDKSRLFRVTDVVWRIGVVCVFSESFAMPEHLKQHLR